MQKTTCLTANCPQGISLAICVLGSVKVSLYNCFFSYQDGITHSENFSKEAHKNALAFYQLYKMDICFLYELRNKCSHGGGSEKEPAAAFSASLMKISGS